MNKYLIFSKTILGDWNDPSEFLESHSLILDVANGDEELITKTDLYNKFYYENLPSHYSLSKEQCESIKDLLNISEEKYREFYNYWPDTFSNQVYNELKGKLNINFVQKYLLNEAELQRHYLIYNRNFWFKSTNKTFVNDSISTYERDFLMQELSFDKIHDAEVYRVLIAIRLWATRGPDDQYYFKKRLSEEINKLDEKLFVKFKLTKQQLINKLVPDNFYGFDMRYSNEYDFYSIQDKEEKVNLIHQEYLNTFEKHKEHTQLFRDVYQIMENPPFIIYKF